MQNLPYFLSVQLLSQQFIVPVCKIDSSRSWINGLIVLLLPSDMWQQRAEIFSVQFTALDNLLSSFNSSLIPLSQNAHSSEYFSFAFVTHLTTKVAIITLHSKLRDISSESAEKVLSAAEACTDMIAGNISSDSTAHANPLLPSLWMTIGQVLIEELRRLRSEHQFRGVARAPGREEAIDVKLQQVLTTMRHTPAHSPLNGEIGVW